MLAVAPVEHAKLDPPLVLRKRLRAEMEALCGLVKKAEMLVVKVANDGSRHSFGNKGRRFLEAESRPEQTSSTTERGQRAPRKGRRYRSKNVESRISASKSKAANDGVAPHRCNEGRCFLDAGAGTKATEDQKTECAKKRKAMLVTKIVETRIPASKRKAANGGTAPRRCTEGGRLRFLEAEARPESTEDQKTECAKKRKTMPPTEIVEPRMAKRETVSLALCVASLSAKTPTTHFEKEAAANVSRSPVSLPSPCQLEEGEIIEEEDDDAFVDICGGVSPVPAVRPSSPLLVEDGMCGEASPVAVQEFAEADDSPSSSSSSGSPYSDSSDSDSSDSDDDAESVGSSPAPDVPRKMDASPVVAAAHKVLQSSPCLREDGEMEEGECGGASPVSLSAEEFVATGNSPRTSCSISRSADDESVGSIPAPFFLPERDEEPEKPEEQRKNAEQSEEPVAAAPSEMSDLIAKARTKMRRDPARQKAYDELEAMERKAVPTNWIHPMHMMKFGITKVVEYAVTSDGLVPGRGGPVQQWFGLSWKGE